MHLCCNSRILEAINNYKVHKKPKMKINLQHQIKLLVNDIVDLVPVLILYILHMYHMSITFL